MTGFACETLDRLKKIDTPTICNLIELFDVRPRNSGYMDDRIQACFPELQPMVGFAATVTFRSAEPPRGADGYAAIERQMERLGELSGPAVIVFQDLDSPPAAATFGEVMCTIYQAFGVTGLITSGAGRDLDEVRALNFPTFTGGTICSHGHNQILDLQVPVQVGGLTVYSDDLLHGDRNGVTTIPHEIADELPGVRDEFAAAEAIVMEAMRGGKPSLKRLQDARRECWAKIERLSRRVSRSG